MRTSSRRRPRRRRHQIGYARSRKWTATPSRSSESKLETIGQAKARRTTTRPSRSSQCHEKEDGTEQIKEGDDDVQQIKMMMETQELLSLCIPSLGDSVTLCALGLRFCPCVCVCLCSWLGPSNSPYCETVSKYGRILVRLR